MVVVQLLSFPPSKVVVSSYELSWSFKSSSSSSSSEVASSNCPSEMRLLLVVTVVDAVDTTTGRDSGGDDDSKSCDIVLLIPVPVLSNACVLQLEYFTEELSHTYKFIFWVVMEYYFTLLELLIPLSGLEF